MTNEEIWPVQTPVDAPETPAIYQLKDRASLVSHLVPRFWGVKLDDFDESFTEQLVAGADPDNLRAYLIDVPPHTTGAVSYTIETSRRTRRDIWVALEPSEYTDVTRHVGRTGTAAAQSSQAKRPAEMFTEEQRARSQRAAVHRLDGRLGKMQAYLDNVLKPRDQLLGKFLKAAEYPNLSMFGKEVTLLGHLATYRGILDSSFRAIGNRLDWNERQALLASRSIAWRLAIDNEGHHNTDYFRELTQVLRDHNRAKAQAFLSRVVMTKHDIAERTTD